MFLVQSPSVYQHCCQYWQEHPCKDFVLHHNDTVQQIQSHTWDIQNPPGTKFWGCPKKYIIF